jgi:hypothetical protein
MSLGKRNGWSAGSQRNLVAKNAWKANRAHVMRDRKNDYTRKIKHRSRG